MARISGTLKPIAGNANSALAATDADFLTAVDTLGIHTVAVVVTVLANGGTAWTATANWQVTIQHSDESGGTYTNVPEEQVAEAIEEDGVLAKYAAAHPTAETRVYFYTGNRRYLQVGLRKTGAAANVGVAVQVVSTAPMHRNT